MQSVRNTFVVYIAIQGCQGVRAVLARLTIGEPEWERHYLYRAHIFVGHSFHVGVYAVEVTREGNWGGCARLLASSFEQMAVQRLSGR